MTNTQHEPKIASSKLSSCPNRPNCVSSLTTDDEQYVPPFEFVDPPLVEMRRLEKLIGSMQGATITEVTEHYLHAEFRSRVFHFVDDVELFWDQSERKCHVRSASRTGYYDFGQNRKRIEEIRLMFTESRNTRSN
ncbi:MAG: DUF1499 domain-containing protein [Arenicellales bacterium]